MKPGHGEVLIAEGDVELADDEMRLVEEFRRQLDAGLWAAVPSQRSRRPASRPDGPLVRRRPPGRRPCDLLPARCGRALRSSHCWRSWPRRSWPSRCSLRSCSPRRGADLPSPCPPPHGPVMPYDPGRERRAELRARALLRSCVEEEDWAMYRDLGFIRRGTQADGQPTPAGRAGRPTPTSSIPTGRSSPTSPRPTGCSTSTAWPFQTSRGPTAAPDFPTPTTCWPSGWR